MSYRKYVVLDAVALFYFQMSKMPKILKDLQQKIINGEATAIIPTIAISEILWKLRKEGIKELESLKIAYLNWKKSPNIIIDSFDVEILDKSIPLNRVSISFKVSIETSSLPTSPKDFSSSASYP